MNGHYLLNPTVKGVKNVTIFYYIHATFLCSTSHNCVLVKLISSDDTTMHGIYRLHSLSLLCLATFIVCLQRRTNIFQRGGAEAEGRLTGRGSAPPRC